jgi:tRNA(Ile2) C34 agmatinyltransferase TiaS
MSATGSAMTKGARLRVRLDEPGQIMRDEVAAGMRPKLSSRTIERMAELEFARRTHGGWTTPDCPTCGLRIAANGTCDCADERTSDEIATLARDTNVRALLTSLGIGDRA